VRGAFRGRLEALAAKDGQRRVSDVGAVALRQLAEVEVRAAAAQDRTMVSTGGAEPDPVPVADLGAPPGQVRIPM
jgi:hypothetical protein